MNEIFADILDKDEEIIRVFKPNKKRFISVNVIFVLVLVMPLALFCIAIATLVIAGVFNMIDSYGVDGTIPFSVFCFTIGGILVFSCAHYVIYSFVSYKKTYFAYSNKRIIIRRGFIGVDYFTLDISAISTVLVNVGLLDKIIKPNTGTIIFGSSSTPLLITKNASSIKVAFNHIDNAYATYKEIKEIANSHKI